VDVDIVPKVSRIAVQDDDSYDGIRYRTVAVAVVEAVEEDHS
jgi:hypothetical protein